MGATGQPEGGTGGRDDRPGPWWQDRGAIASAVFGAGVVICTAAMEVVGRSTQVVLLAVTVALVLASLAALVRGRTYARLFGAVGVWVGGHRILVTVGTVVLVSTVVVAAALLRSVQSCDDPTELAVMVPEDGAAGFAATAAAFEQDTTTAFACPRYHVTAFPVAWPALRTAFASGWKDASGEGEAPSSSLGPRPDVWIAESGAQQDIVTTESAGTDFRISSEKVVAGSPLVLAVPEPYVAELTATVRPGDTLSELIAAAGVAGLDVVRANPDTSFASALHTVALYEEADTEADAAALELDLGRALEQTGLPVGADNALLCRLDELSREEPLKVAVLTTERAIADGSTACPAPLGAGGDVELVPFYPAHATGVDYTAFQLDWAGHDAGRRSAAAADFVTWLATADGQVALKRSVGARGLDGRLLSGGDPQASALQDVPPAEPGADPVEYARILAAEKGYAAARRPARVLVLVDSSASMGRPADGERQRIDVARRGVLGALEHLEGADEVGIWSFSGTSGSSPDRVLDLTQSRDAAPDSLATLRPGGYTPLYDAIAEGTSYLADLDSDGAARKHLTALVVLTDGENRPGDGQGTDPSAADLVAAAGAEAEAGVRVYVVAVGEASCQVSDLQQVAKAWHGECWDSSFGELENTLGSLFGQLGGR